MERIIRGVACSLLLLGLWGLGTSASAQFKSSERASRPDTLGSLAPTSLDERRSLKRYVRAPDAPTMGARLDVPARQSPTLSRGQKMLWGSVGLVVQSLCNTDGEKPLTARPDFVFDQRERTCIHCDRMEDRAWNAVLEGVFSSSP